MIINNNAVKIESNIEPSKALNFGISDVRLVVDILSKLYAYPIRTLVQEYICNGRDAMREANTWGKIPIEITVPNTLDPVFKVRDFGVGISPDRMENIFVNYGSSTKRNTNTQTGGFGIGAKSAFSYTDSFTVTSFYNGVRYLYVAHLGDEGGVNLISKNNTSQPNGVEISIGVKSKDIPEFKNAIQRCVRFWQEPIKFSGSKDIHQLKPILTLPYMDVFSVSGNESRTIYLIDGIEYEIMSDNSSGYWKAYREEEFHSGNSVVALRVNNGHFKIASSRERLENNDDNKAKQKTILNNCRDHIQRILDTQINSKTVDLKTKLSNKEKYSCFHLIADTSIDIGSGFRLKSDVVISPISIQYRHIRRGRRRSEHYELSDTTGLRKDVIVYKSTDNDNNTARKLNFYLSQNKEAILVNETSITNIPFQDIIFTNRLDADTLPLPPKKTAQRTQKSTRDAICWFINTDGERSSHTIDYLNQSSAPSVIIEELTDDAKEIARFMRVVMIPKCNKDLVLKKGMSIEQGRKFLLSSNKNEVLGLSDLPFNHDKVDVLKKFKRKTIGSDLQNFLFKYFPNLKKEHDNMQKEYNDLIKKYPLITVLNNLDGYRSQSTKIVVDEINKQSKEK